ncbi:MAG: LptA/OstA family protein [Planctomycetota bacterium]|nr:LptA/OstA family protein [Planctomycetota bacterium]
MRIKKSSLILMMMVLVVPAAAQDSKKVPKTRAEKLSIKADHVNIGQKGETIFKGHVKIRIGDYEIRTDELVRGAKSKTFEVPGLMKCYQRTGKKELVGEAKSGTFDLEKNLLILEDVKTLGLFGEGQAEKAHITINDNSGTFYKARFKDKKWGAISADRCVVVKQQKMILSGNVIFNHEQGRLKCKRLTLSEDYSEKRPKVHYESGDVKGFFYRTKQS